MVLSLQCLLYVVELHWVTAAGPNNVFEGRMDLTALYKELNYKKKKEIEKKGRKNPKHCNFPIAKSLPFALISLLYLLDQNTRLFLAHVFKPLNESI